MNAKGLIWALVLTALPVHAAEPTAEETEHFEKKIRPLLVEHCYSCHSAMATKLKGGLRVDSRPLLLTGGDTGPALVPGQPEKSKLIQAITYKDVDLQMPPSAKLPEAAINELTAWVKQGAPWPGKAETEVAGPKAFDLAKRKESHWAWRLIQETTPPAVKDTKWPLATSDRYLLAKIEEKGLAPAKPAAANVLLRRIYFDLIGLPPTPIELETFEKDHRAASQAAIERVVDRLLASPQFGERWARHWLDLVRYGESRGHEFEPTIPNAWQYRDYVIRALNADVPYNQFVTEHVAGDLLAKPRLHPTERFNESVLGTGFWHLGEEVHSPVDIRADEADRFDNRIDVFSKTFTALTVSCARCHDHKFDAISTNDYYAIYGFLRSSSYRQVRFDTLEHNREIVRQLEALRDKHRPAVLAALGETFKPGLKQLTKIRDEAIVSLKSGKVSDNELVRFWVTHLEKARRNPDDPFHIWAIDGLPAAVPPSPFERYESIVDYGNLKPGQWLTDDVGFHLVVPGQPRFGTDKLRPILRFHEVAAAEADPATREVKAATGSQNDHGALGITMRTGRTLHTPGFTIGAGPVHFLVKGSGKSYAAVDAHTIIAGPLHGALLRNFNTAGKWQWIAHDLKNYQGHHAHMEFSPSDDNDFAVAKVVQGDKPIVDAPKEPELKKGDLDPLTAARFTSDLRLLMIGNAFEKDELRTESLARLANWMLDNAGLLGVTHWDKVSAASATFLEEQAKLAAQIRKESRLALALIDNTGHNEKVFIRGSHKALGETVPRRFLEALAGTKGIDSTGSGRLELATQMTDPAINPFITRVMVNRVWHHLFGRGIVASTDNFGVLGERPTHPELLDHLALRFTNQGWSTKALIRELVLSRAYQMASTPEASADLADPENLLLHRMRLRRLEGEAIRDAMLAVSGRFNEKMYGPSVPVHLTPFLDGRGRPASGPIDGDGRRSLYIAVRRNFLSPMMLAFDTPSPFSTVGRRSVSNVPAQALILMNDPFVHQMAALWGKKMAMASGSAPARIDAMYQRAFGRHPSQVEQESCEKFLADQPQGWAELAHVLFNVKDFIFVD